METQITTIIIDSLKSEISDLKNVIAFNYITTLAILCFYTCITWNGIKEIQRELKRKKDLERDEK